MNTKAEQWIEQAKQSDTLVANFVDCQNIEHIKPYRTATFNRIAAFGDALRQTRTRLTHFIYIDDDEAHPKPFQYKDTLNDKTLIPEEKDQFEIAIPDGNEWVYPKTSRNGFKNPHSCKIIEKDCATIVFAGFVSGSCVARTMAGSFAHALSPDQHRVILASDATDDYYKGVKITKQLLARNEDTAHLQANVTHAPVANIMRFIRQ